jgi:hypothetical protein
VIEFAIAADDSGDFRFAQEDVGLYGLKVWPFVASS